MDNIGIWGPRAEHAAVVGFWISAGIAALAYLYILQHTEPPREIKYFFFAGLVAGPMVMIPALITGSLRKTRR